VPWEKIESNKKLWDTPKVKTWKLLILYDSWYDSLWNGTEWRLGICDKKSKKCWTPELGYVYGRRTQTSLHHVLGKPSWVRVSQLGTHQHVWNNGWLVWDNGRNCATIKFQRVCLHACQAHLTLKDEELGAGPNLSNVRVERTLRNQLKTWKSSDRHCRSDIKLHSVN